MSVKTKDPKETKSRLDRGVVIAAATLVADREGLESLTIRRLATELGVTPMALYWHFEDKQALLDAVVDEMWAEAWKLLEPSLHTTEGQEWETIRHLINVLIEVFNAHSTLARFAPMRITECEFGLSITEETLELLRRVGMDPEQASGAARYALCAAVMLVDDQPGSAILDQSLREEMMRRKIFTLSTLSPERYPRIREASSYLVACDAPELYYQAGVDLIVGGMKSQVSS